MSEQRIEVSAEKDGGKQLGGKWAIWIAGNDRRFFICGGDGGFTFYPRNRAKLLHTITGFPIYVNGKLTLS